MEAVDEAPGEVARERLEPRVAKHVEQRRHHHFQRCAGLLGIGHLALLGLVDGRQLGAFVVLDERTLVDRTLRSEEHTSELQSLLRISYAGFCMKKKKEQE